MGTPKTLVEERPEDFAGEAVTTTGAIEPVKTQEDDITGMALERSIPPEGRVIEIRRKHTSLTVLKRPAPSPTAVQAMKDLREVGLRDVPLHPVGKKIIGSNLCTDIMQFSGEIIKMNYGELKPQYRDFTGRNTHMLNLMSKLVDASMKLQVMEPDVAKYQAVKMPNGTIKFTIITEKSYVGLHAPIIDFFNVIQAVFAGIPLHSCKWESYPAEKVEVVNTELDITVKNFLATANDWEDYTDLGDAPLVFRIIRATLRHIARNELYNKAKNGDWKATILFLHKGFRLAMCDVYIVNAIEKGRARNAIKALEIELRAQDDTQLEEAMNEMHLEDSNDERSDEDAMSVHEEEDGTIRVHFAGDHAQENAQRFLDGHLAGQTAVMHTAPVVESTGCRLFGKWGK